MPGSTGLGSGKAWVVLALICLAAGPACAASKRVLVVYSAEYRLSWTVAALTNLLGHFDCDVTTLPAAKYTPGRIDATEATFYLGARRERLPQSLLRDVYDAEPPVCWIGENLDQLAARFSLGRYGFRLTGAQVKCGLVTYRQRPLAPAESRIAEIVADRPDLCQILATGATRPYAVHSGRFWYFPEMPLAAVDRIASWLVLADQLHDILGESHPDRSTAFVCLTGVNPQTSPRAVRALVKAISEEGAPVAVAVTALYRDPAKNREGRLYEQDELVQALQEAQRKGAAILALGLTYQSAARTGEEAEFWDEARRGPLLERSSEDTHRRLDQAVNELAACGLYAVVWATPRGLAAPADYYEMAQSFSTAWENRLPGMDAPLPQALPYPLRRDVYGQQILPGGLSLLGESTPARALLEPAHLMGAVRDPWVSFAITPDASPQEVRRLITALRQAGWQFADLRQRDNWVKSTPLQIYTRVESARLGDLRPVGWSGTLFLPDGSRDRRYERPTKEGGAGQPALPAGAILVAYPPGVNLDSAFVGGGPVRRLARTLVADITRTVTLFAIGACSLFLLIYLSQVVLQRRRA